MSKKILIDFQKIQDPYSGLGQFCQHLKFFFDKSELNLRYWIPGKFQKLAKKLPFILPDCEVFHAVHQDSPFMPGRTKTKYILTIHDLNALYENTDPLFQKSYKASLQIKINRASVVTFISQFTKSEVEKNFDLKNKMIEVIYNGISLVTQSELPVSVPNGKLIFSIGTVVPKKNFHILVDFIKELPSDYKLVLAGTTFHIYAKKLKEKIIEQGLEDRFYLVGTINEKQKLWYYQNAVAFIFPSLLEGFGLPVAEAMSLGLPLFLSDKSSLPEIAGIDAYYFKNFDPQKMAQTFLNGMNEFDETKKLRLIERAKLFDWKKASERYLEIYNNL